MRFPLCILLTGTLQILVTGEPTVSLRTIRTYPSIGKRLANVCKDRSTGESEG